MVRDRSKYRRWTDPRKYTSNGTAEASSASRLKHHERLLAEGRRQAKAEAAAAIAAAQAEAKAARAEAQAERAHAAAVDSQWQEFNDTNLADGRRSAAEGGGTVAGSAASANKRPLATGIRKLREIDKQARQI